MSTFKGPKQNIAPQHPMANRLGYVLKRAQHALRTSMDDHLSAIGLTTAQFNVLSCVGEQPGISNAALARFAFVTAQSMQGIVANLEKMGLLHRKPHRHHGRILETQLTLEGTKALASARKAIAGVESSLTAGFSEKEIGTLRSMLERCAENMDRR